MNINVLKTVLLAHLDKSIKMCIVAVNAAVGEQTPDMEVGVVLLAVLDSAEELFVLKEDAVLDILCDESEVLVDDTAGTDVHVTYLGVTHLSVRKSYSKSGSISELIRALCHQLIHNGCVSHLDGVTLFLLRDAVAVEDHHYYRFLSHINISCLLIY